MNDRQRAGAIIAVHLRHRNRVAQQINKRRGLAVIAFVLVAVAMVGGTLIIRSADDEASATLGFYGIILAGVALLIALLPPLVPKNELELSADELAQLVDYVTWDAQLGPIYTDAGREAWAEYTGRPLAEFTDEAYVRHLSDRRQRALRRRVDGILNRHGSNGG